MSDLDAIKTVGSDILTFTTIGSNLKLRRYQTKVASAIVDSVIHRRGLTFVVIFPRQSGKNELQAQIEAYLLSFFSLEDAEIVKVSPTWKPQSLNAMRRLRRVLERNSITLFRWSKESSYIYRIGRARIFFLSGSPTANVVGATASTLLECDEAQDVLPAKWDKDFAPMAASTNATRVFWGTASSSKTLLAREMRLAQEAERADGIQRVFKIDANLVSKEVPAYGRFVQEQVSRFGRQHPAIKTQLFSEEIDSENGMFPATRLALLTGSHPRIHSPQAGAFYALLIDVAGEDEGMPPSSDRASEMLLANPHRDSTALTVVQVDLGGLADPLVKALRYHIVDRCSWIGTKHAHLYGQIKALAEHWRARYLVVDATGVGAGLASFLGKSLPGKVIPYVFNASTKSQLGWKLIGMIETGRLKDYASPAMDKDQCEFVEQLQACQMEIVPGPENRMKWGVLDGTRSQETGGYVHDDWVISAALAAVLDEQVWTIGGPTLIVQRRDPLLDMDGEGF